MLQVPRGAGREGGSLPARPLDQHFGCTPATVRTWTYGMSTLV